MKKTVKGEITHRLELSGKDILELLPELGTNYTPNDTATVEFMVPSGGDYSGCLVGFEDQHRVIVTWVVRENHSGG